MAAPVDKDYDEEIKKARDELLTSISKEKSSARDLLRVAYASQFSIDKPYNDGAETTAKNHHKTIEQIHTNHPSITYRDLYQLAGIVAVEALDGPKIEFVPSRKDSPISPDASCLPDLKQIGPKELKDSFGKVKISDPKHIVALYGGLKLATAGDQGADLKFDNKYFSDLAKSSDKALREDQEFRNIVERYANNKNEFSKDYAEAHKKLLELGLPASASVEVAFKKGASEMQKVIATTPKAVGVGVAVAAAVVIFSIFYLIHKRRTQHQSQQFP